MYILDGFDLVAFNAILGHSMHISQWAVTQKRVGRAAKRTEICAKGH